MLKEQEKLLEKAKNQGFMPELVKIFEDDEEGLSRYNVAELKKLYKLMRFYIKDQADLAKRADMLIYVVEECEEMYIPDNFERTYAAMVYITECEKRYGSTYNMRWLVMQLAAMELTWDEIDLIVRRTVNTPGLGQSKWRIPDIVHDAKERGCGMDDICIYLDIYIKALDGDRCYFKNCSKFIDRIERYKTYGISHDNIILNEKLIKRGDYDEVCLRIIERTYPDIRNFVKGFKKAADNIEKAAGFKTLYHCNNALYCYDIDDVKSYVEFCRLREKMGKAYKCGTTAMTIYVPVTEVLYDMSLSGICLKFSFYDGLHLKKSSQATNRAGSDFYISPRETPQTVKEYLITADMNMYVKRNKKWIPLQLQELGIAFTYSPAIKEMFMFFINQFIKMKKNAWKDALPSLDDYAVSGLPKLAANELTAAMSYDEAVKAHYQKARFADWNKNDRRLCFIIMTALPKVEEKYRDSLTALKDLTPDDMIDMYGIDITENKNRTYSIVENVLTAVTSYNVRIKGMADDIKEEFAKKFVPDGCADNMKTDVDEFVHQYISMMMRTKQKAEMDFDSAEDFVKAYEKAQYKDISMQTPKFAVPKDSAFNGLKKLLPSNFKWIKTKKDLILKSIEIKTYIYSYARKIKNDKCAVYTFECPDNGIHYAAVFTKARNGKYKLWTVYSEYEFTAEIINTEDIKTAKKYISRFL